jgi:hypothetical protein
MFELSDAHARLVTGISLNRNRKHHTRQICLPRPQHSARYACTVADTDDDTDDDTPPVTLETNVNKYTQCKPSEVETHLYYI